MGIVWPLWKQTEKDLVVITVELRILLITTAPGRLFLYGAEYTETVLIARDLVFCYVVPFECRM